MGAVLASPSPLWAGGSSKASRDKKGAGASGSSAAPGAAGAAGAPAVGATGRPLNPSDYPFAYRPVGYLGTVGPAPMRFTAATPPGNERTPPRISASNKRLELGTTAEKMAHTEAIEAYRSVFGRKVPVPEGSIAGGEVDPNFVGPERIFSSAGADEPRLMDFFPPPELDPKAQERRLRFMFDPLFEAARPPDPAAGGVQRGTPPVQNAPGVSLPASRATFRQAN
jgi:hypothetical protein